MTREKKLTQNNHTLTFRNLNENVTCGKEKLYLLE